MVRTLKPIGFKKAKEHEHPGVNLRKRYLAKIGGEWYFGRFSRVWFCPNEIWNRIQREGEHFFCSTCFTILAEERGLVPTGWFVRPERENDGEFAAHIAQSAKQTEEVERLKAALRGIRDMPEYDQDDCHRLRNRAGVALGKDDQQEDE